MSFAVQLASAAPEILQRLRLTLAVFAVAALGVAWLVAGTSSGPWSGVAALVGSGVILARLRWPGAAAACGVLRIDDLGQASWLGPGRSVAVPVQVQQWHLVGRLAWLRLRLTGDPDAGARDLDVLFWRRTSRGEWTEESVPGTLPGGWVRRRVPGEAGVRRAPVAGVAEDGWRRLGAWLLWYGRGPVSNAAPDASGEAVSASSARAGE